MRLIAEGDPRDGAWRSSPDGRGWALAWSWDAAILTARQSGEPWLQRSQPVGRGFGFGW